MAKTVKTGTTRGKETVKVSKGGNKVLTVQLPLAGLETQPKEKKVTTPSPPDE